MSTARAVMHGAVSIVNAIATGKGSTLGISLNVESTIESAPGCGIVFENKESSLSSRLIRSVVEKAVPKNELEKYKLRIFLNSEIPSGYGLKSSSAISSVISLACAKLFRPQIDDFEVLRHGVEASLETKVSITGAFDDACACYFGGFIVTDNHSMKLVKSEKAPEEISAVIFIPKSRKRGNVKNLKILAGVFEQAWALASKSDYWNAMLLNGLATSAILNSDPRILTDLIEAGALGASVSGNGPSIAAVAKKENVSAVKKIFSSHEGEVLVSEINNKKAEVYEV
ncbi:MAG TPA: shikimate kinase [Nitrosopumilaceae archaeon]|nr:shikimate kinase [Nitrosopumilaceae archaeon]